MLLKLKTQFGLCRVTVATDHEQPAKLTRAELAALFAYELGYAERARD